MNLNSGAEAAKHDAATIGIRPEHCDVSTTEGLWKGRAGVAEHLGSDPGDIAYIRLGNSHRAHQSRYLHRLMQQGIALDWVIIGGGGARRTMRGGHVCRQRNYSKKAPLWSQEDQAARH